MSKHKSKHHHKPARRNAGPTTSPRRRRAPAAPAPDLNTTIASAMGGGGAAVLGGILANREILSPTAIGLAMAVGGAIGAYTMDGNARVAANGVAAAGAGQLALGLLQKHGNPKAPRRKDPDDEPTRQGRGRVARNFQMVAPEAAVQLGYADAVDDDEIDDDEDFID